MVLDPYTQDFIQRVRNSSVGPQPGILSGLRAQSNPADYSYATATPTEKAASSGGFGLTDILDFISRPQRGVTGFLAELSDGDNSGFLDALSSGWKGVSGQEKRDFGEVLTNFGMQDKKGLDLHDILGFVGDVAFDPLTYLTLGAGSAVKAGKAAAKTAAKDVAEKYGTSAASKPFDTGRKIADEYRARYADSTYADPYLINQVARDLERDLGKQIGDAAKSARASNQNNLINFDIPFTNITKGFGQLPSFMRKSEGAIGEIGGNSARTLLAQLGLKEGDQLRLLQERYGVDSADKLTMQAFEDLQGLRGVDPDNWYTRQPPDVQRDASQLFEGDNPFTRPSLPSPGLPGPSGMDQLLTDVLTGFGSRRSQQARNVVDGEFTDPNQFDLVSELLQRNGGEFVQDMGGTSKAGALNPMKYFNPRSFRSGDAVVDNAASRIQDAENTIFGGMKQLEKDIDSIGKDVAKLTADEQRSLIYLIENDFPINAPIKKESMSQAAVQVADRMKTILDNIGQSEVRSGVMDQLRQNYFPHVMKQTPEEYTKMRNKYKNDKELYNLLGRSQSNRFNQERTSFDTIAQADNYIAGLAEKLQKLSPDSGEYAKIKEKMDDVAGLFETDPVKALAQRYYKSIRSTSMASLYDQFRKDGIIVQGIKGADSLANAAGTKGMVQLKDAQIKQLGLRVKDDEHVYMHETVLDGLKRVEGLFTDKGVNKFMDNLDSAVSVWKNLVTTAVPSHYWNNFIGNIANMMLAGANMTSLGRAASIMKNNSDPALIKEALDAGVLNQGYTSDFTRNALQFGNDARNGLSRVADAVSNNKVVKGMRNVGDLMDNWTRLALYIDAKDRLGSAKAAAQEVRKYLFNYREMTNADRYMRAAMPFWNWTKNNLPLQLEKLATTPRFYATYDKLKRDMFDESAPDYIKQDYIPMGDGTARPLRLPMNDLDQIFNPIKMVGSSLNPLIKSPAELELNKQFFSGNPISWDNMTESAWGTPEMMEYLKKQTGIVGRGIDVAKGDMGLLDLIFGKATELKQ